MYPEKSLFPRRKVYGLILWVGSNDRYNIRRTQLGLVSPLPLGLSLTHSPHTPPPGLLPHPHLSHRYNMLRTQLESVRLQHKTVPRWVDEERIFGWAATEDVYPCR